MCRVLGVSSSGYYAWRRRFSSRRWRSEQVLKHSIVEIHRTSYGTYGAPRIHRELAEQGIHGGKKRVARLLQEARLQGVHRRRWVSTTRRSPGARPAPDLVQRHFVASGPDRLWVSDITAIPTGQGVLYLAVILDVWSRRVIGWSVRPHMRTLLVLEALEMAVAQRDPEAVIHHSDQGSQGVPRPPAQGSLSTEPGWSLVWRRISAIS